MLLGDQERSFHLVGSGFLLGSLVSFESRYVILSESGVLYKGIQVQCFSKQMIKGVFFIGWMNPAGCLNLCF